MDQQEPNGHVRDLGLYPEGHGKPLTVLNKY